jgi:hypothetical protein
MEIINQFSRGLHTDLPEISQPEGTYKSLWNAIRLSDGSPKNELGHILTQDFNTLSIIGAEVLDTEVIVCLTDGIRSQIGVFNDNDVFTVYLDHTALSFRLDAWVSIEVKKDYRGHRIMYFTDGVNSMRRLNLDEVATIPLAKLDKHLSLLLKYTIPAISLKSVNETGSLPTGVYQFAARLVTDSMDKTAFSFVTNPIPIVDEAAANGNKKYDGALPQTPSNKSITLTLSNIDTDYKYIEVCAISYEGTANISQADIVGVIPINGKTTTEFIYANTAQQKERINLNEVIQEFAYYDYAKHSLQKDGRLLFANLSSIEESFDFQAVANKMTIEWKVETISDKLTDTTLSGYRNPETAATKVGYQRGEAYSFALVPIFKGRKFGNAYHIPASLTGVNYAVANTVYPATSTLCGVKTSSLVYPTDQSYPNTFIRYHVMPTHVQAPLTDEFGNINIIGIKESTPEFTAAMLDKLEGYVIVRRPRLDNDKTILSQGIAQPMMQVASTLSKYLVPTPYTGKIPYASYLNASGTSLDLNIAPTEVMFTSPDTVILQKDLRAATSIQAVGNLIGTQRIVKTTMFESKASRRFSYNILEYTKVRPITPLNKDIVSNSMVYVPADDKDTMENIKVEDWFASPATAQYSKRGNYGYFALTLTGNLPIDNAVDANGKPEFYVNPTLIQLRQSNGTTSTSSTGISERYLYNLVTSRPTQYGEVYDAQYMQVGYRLFATPTTSTLFGGDVFINRFAVQLNAYDMYLSTTPNEYEDQTKYMGLSYFYCESTENMAYRHYVTEGEANLKGEKGTVPYYPKYEKLWEDDGSGIMQTYTSFGHPRGYNKQYSFQNFTRIFFPKQLGFKEITDYSNRVIYSDISKEGVMTDSYRTFLINDYHDIPKNKGKIEDIFDHGGSLYIHTNQTLFKSFFNEQTTQATSSGDIVLGNGGLFPIPSREIMTIDGGYAGTTNKWASCGTPFGRYFVDKVQGKVFVLTEGLKEISDQGMFNFFFSGFTNNFMVSAFDYKHKRWILSTDTFTISYAPALDSWSSFHNYSPSFMFSKGNKLYMAKGTKLYQANKGDKGKFFDQAVSPMSMEFIVNPAVVESKMFDSMVFHVSSSNASVERPWDMFDKIRISNKVQNTGLLDIKVPTSFNEEHSALGLNEVFAKRKSNEFRLAVPSDLVKNPAISIFTPSNLHTSRLFRPRISGKYITVFISYANKDNNEFQLHALKTEFRPKAG